MSCFDDFDFCGHYDDYIAAHDRCFEPDVPRNNSFFADVFMLRAAAMRYQSFAEQ